MKRQLFVCGWPRATISASHTFSFIMFISLLVPSGAVANHRPPSADRISPDSTDVVSDVRPVAIQDMDSYPLLPEPWQYHGYAYDPEYDFKNQSNFFLDRREIYSECPGLELVHAGHHGGTHMAVQYRDQEDIWHWRPALYPDALSMPEYPPIADPFSGCYFSEDLEWSGAYFVAYQRSDSNGCHAVFYMAPRDVQSPDQQPFDGHALLTMRTTEYGPGDPICKAGMWHIPVAFTKGEKCCLLCLPTGHLSSELEDVPWATYAVVFDRDPDLSWMDVPTNGYQLVWIESEGDWIPLRWNAMEILGGELGPGDNPGLQAQAAVFEVDDLTYMLVVAGVTKNNANWSNPTTRGLISLYRFLEGPAPGPGMDYCVVLEQAVVNPVKALPNTAAMVGGFIPGAIRPLPIRLNAAPAAVPSFVCGVGNRGDPDRWMYDWGWGPQYVAGGFVVIRGFPDLNGHPLFEVIPPEACPEGSCDYHSGYGLCVVPHPEGDDVICKLNWENGWGILHVPNNDGMFHWANARVLLDVDDVIPSEDWEPYFFSACFLGLFDSDSLEGEHDLVVPFSVQEREGPGGPGFEHIRHMYIIRKGLGQTGDCNGDGTVNVLDVLWVVNCILGIIPQPCLCDCTGDGVNNILDALCIVNIILGVHPTTREMMDER